MCTITSLLNVMPLCYLHYLWINHLYLFQMFYKSIKMSAESMENLLL